MGEFASHVKLKAKFSRPTPILGAGMLMMALAELGQCEPARAIARGDPDIGAVKSVFDVRDPREALAGDRPLRPLAGVEGLPSSNKINGLARQTGLTASIESKELYRRSANLRERPPDPKRRRPAFAGPGGADQIEAGQLQNKKYADPPRGATILGFPGACIVIGGEPVFLSPALRRCIARMREGGPLRSGEADEIVARRRR